MGIDRDAAKGSVSPGDSIDVRVKSEIESLLLDETLAKQIETWDGRLATREERILFLTDILKSRNRRNSI